MYKYPKTLNTFNPIFTLTLSLIHDTNLYIRQNKQIFTYLHSIYLLTASHGYNANQSHKKLNYCANKPQTAQYILLTQFTIYHPNTTGWVTGMASGL